MLNSQAFSLRLSSILIAGLLSAGCSSSNDGSPFSPVGTQLLVGGAFTLRGMTSDGWIVYSDNTTLTLHAAPIAGGSPQDIVTLGDSFAISVWGRHVFAWPHKNDMGVAPLTIWSVDGGVHQVSDSSLAPWVAAAPDGSSVLFLDKVDPGGQTGALVSAWGDGSNPTTLITGLQGLSNPGCRTLLGYAGHNAIAAHCPDGLHATISSFDVGSWQRADLASMAADAWATNADGTMLMTATGSGTVVVPVAGGTPTVVDSAGGTGVFLSDGQNVVYGAAGGQLRRSGIAMPSPSTLVTSGVTGLYGASPNDQYVLYYKSMDAVHLVSDMYLASATMPGNAITLVGTQTGGIYGDAFTQDSSHLLYSTEVDTSQQTSTLNALQLTPEASPVVIAHNVSVTLAATGAKAVYNDNFQWLGIRNHADIRVVDTSKSEAPTLIVNQADSEIFLSPARDAVVYTWSLEDSPRAGLYVAAIP